MTELLKKGVKFVWDDKCEKAFHTLRAQLTTVPVVAQPDNTKPFDVYCDTSGTGLGCVLMQDNRSLLMLPEHSDPMRRTILLMI